MQKRLPWRLGLLATLFFNTALASSSVGDWYHVFYLKGGNYVIHTPENVSLDGMIYATSIDMDSSSFNGMTISEKGLHLKTQESEEDFIKALKNSGLYDEESPQNQ